MVVVMLLFVAAVMAAPPRLDVDRLPAQYALTAPSTVHTMQRSSRWEGLRDMWWTSSCIAMLP